MKRRIVHIAAALTLAALAVAASGCSTTRFYERERVADRAMQLDPDSSRVYILNKLAGAREGGFGGFGGAAAGGCGCE